MHSVQLTPETWSLETNLKHPIISHMKDQPSIANVSLCCTVLWTSYEFQIIVTEKPSDIIRRRSKSVTRLFQSSSFHDFLVCKLKVICLLKACELYFCRRWTYEVLSHTAFFYSLIFFWEVSHNKYFFGRLVLIIIFYSKCKKWLHMEVISILLYKTKLQFSNIETARTLHNNWLAIILQANCYAIRGLSKITQISISHTWKSTLELDA